MEGSARRKRRREAGEAHLGHRQLLRQAFLELVDPLGGGRRPLLLASQPQLDTVSPLFDRSAYESAKRAGEEVSASDERTHRTTTGHHTDDETLVALLLRGGETLGGAALQH